MVQSADIVPTSGHRVVIPISRNMTPRGMRGTILDAMEGTPRDMVIDLRAVAAMPDSGLALLVGVHARQQARRRTLTLVFGKGSATEQALARTGLTRGFTVVTALALLPPA